MFQMATGFLFQGFPSVGSWISYGLGTENANLPAFVVLPDPHGMPPGGVAQWSNGFLPAAHQGVIFGDYKEPIADLFPPAGVSAKAQSASYDLLASLNHEHLSANPGEDALLARIKSYELAARMQLSAPDVTDLSRETPATLKAYGVINPQNDTELTAYASNCVLARRLIEKGVRCIQLYNGAHFGKPRRNWDAHEDLIGNHGKLARIMDQPTAALLADLKQRGLMEETLVVWTTEFGRLPISEGLGEGGRDHNPEGFTSFLAGGGLRKGMAYGSTDELGYKAAESPVSIYDLHATVLHLLGLDHTRLTYYHNGLQRRLTDVHGHVIKPILTTA
jgi:hypothetical protein